MRDIAIGKDQWTVLGKCSHKEAMLILKKTDGKSISLSEKDLKPVVTVLDMVRTIMKEETP